MKKRLLNISIVLASLVLASSAMAGGTRVTFKGYLMDKMCSNRTLKSDDPMEKAKGHTRECAIECTDSGFGVLSDKKFYAFDDKGNELAKNLLKTTKKTSGLGIEVTGLLEGDKLSVQSLREVD